MADPKRALKSKGFGRWLRDMRKKHGHKSPDVTEYKLARLGVKASGRIRKYEDGEDARLPAADILWGVSRLFNESADVPLHIIAVDLGYTTTSRRSHAGTPISGTVPAVDELDATAQARGEDDLMPLLSGLHVDYRGEFLRRVGEIYDELHARVPFPKSREKGDTG